MSLITKLCLPVLLSAGLMLLGDQIAWPVDKRNPPSNPAHSIWADGNVPKEVRNILARSCIDCHSNQARWPLISRLPVLSGIFEKDVYSARKQMNLSEWTDFLSRSSEDVQGLRNGICEEARMSNMPPRRYTTIHPGAVVSRSESASLCKWAAAPLPRPARKASGPS